MEGVVVKSCISIKDIDQLICSGDWNIFISRNYPLLITSLWSYCYEIYIPKLISTEVKITHGIYIQDTDGLVHHYRQSGEILQIHNYIFDLINSSDPQIKLWLNEGEGLLSKKPKSVENFEYNLDLWCRSLIMTAFIPHIIVESKIRGARLDERLYTKAKKLRSKSIYPTLILKRLIPFLEKTYGKNVVNSLTFYQLQKISTKGIKPGQYTDRTNFIFKYIKLGKREFVYWKKRVNKPLNDEIAGFSVQPGKIVGKVHVSFMPDGSDILKLKQGDIVVSHSFNPLLNHKIKCASAIIADEFRINDQSIFEYNNALLVYESLGPTPYDFAYRLVKKFKKSINISVISDLAHTRYFIDKSHTQHAHKVIMFIAQNKKRGASHILESEKLRFTKSYCAYLEKQRNFAYVIESNQGRDYYAIGNQASARIEEVFDLFLHKKRIFPGVTHTTLIAQKLKIPCIVGTKNATKVLKTGDIVEVDADKGVVKILKRAR